MRNPGIFFIVESVEELTGLSRPLVTHVSRDMLPDKPVVFVKKS